MFGSGVHLPLARWRSGDLSQHLERLAANDRRIVKGFHSVAKEAADSIQNIQIENIAHRRKNGCAFCVRASFVPVERSRLPSKFTMSTMSDLNSNLVPDT
jgi:hypothetical protein